MKKLIFILQIFIVLTIKAQQPITISGTGERLSTDGNSLTKEDRGTINSISGLTIQNDGTIIFCERYNYKIRKISSKGILTTIAGTGLKGKLDTIGSKATFSEIIDLVTDSKGNVYVTDSQNDLIRKIDKNGDVTTFVGGGTKGIDGQGLKVGLSYPTGMCIDKNDTIYLVENIGNIIRKISPTGYVSTIQINNSTDGTTLSLNSPYDVAIDDSSNLYITDKGSHSIKKITKKGSISTYNNSFSTNISGIAIDNDKNVFICDYNQFKKVDKNGKLSIILIQQIPTSECGTNSFYLDNVTIDGLGNVFISNQYPIPFIVKVNQSNTSTLISGSFVGAAKSIDGNINVASFYIPSSIFSDINGNIYVCEALGCGSIRKIDTNYNVSTIAKNIIGNGIVVDKIGNAFVTTNKGITKILKDGTVISFGSLTNLYGIVIDTLDNIYTTNGSNLYKITPNGESTLVSSFGGFYTMLTIDKYGNIYTAGSGQVIKIANTTYNVSNYASVSSNINGIAIGSDGSVFYNNGYIVQNTLQTTTYSLNENNSTSNQTFGANCFTLGNNGNLLIADFYNNKIKKIINPITTSIDANEFENISFMVYPNPSNDVINVSVSNPSNNYSIKVINQQSSVVYSSVLSNSKIQFNTSVLGVKGLYFIQILDNSNKILDVRKLIVE